MRGAAMTTNLVSSCCRAKAFTMYGKKWCCACEKSCDAVPEKIDHSKCCDIPDDETGL